VVLALGCWGPCQPSPSSRGRQSNSWLRIPRAAFMMGQLHKCCTNMTTADRLLDDITNEAMRCGGEKSCPEGEYPPGFNGC
jgi:hypothetical protein